MKIRQSILEKINEPKCRNRIGSALGIGEQTVAVHMRRNTNDGPLTKMSALLAISKETGVPVEEILEEAEEAETVIGL